MAARGPNSSHLIQSMMLHIGSLDSELRDDLIYGSFYELIREKNLLEHSLLTELLEECLNNLLCKGIAESFLPVHLRRY
ncbi:hypothetical protein [Lysinibacillus sp. FJAT-14745]|uniref:hypothetical protein n=1 Tax=Lysinibacillus sp. FJAT-14745 TaxID=1704289 RepID=UPI000B31CE6B|nr:hypothetical protein [Lysinibacillus sp. FJAT-14745]